MERKITIEEAGVYMEDYQMRMLAVNDIEGLLPVRGRGIDGTSFYDYNVTGKISMQAMYERGKISGEDLKLFLRRLLTVIRETEKYLLNVHCLLLEPEFIFYGEEQFYFCYYPQAKWDLWEMFHKLTEYFVKQTDYGDKESVRITFALHKETMKENYSLEEIVRECLSGESEEIMQKKKEEFVNINDLQLSGEESITKNPGINVMKYDMQNPLKNKEQVSFIMEETENIWTPVRRFFRRRKKPKWGDWDSLYIEEDL